VPVLGIYPTLETLAAQALIVLLIAAVWLWMRSAKRRAVAKT
jgi:hypothetical protein